MGNWSHVSVVYDPLTGRTMFNYIDANEIPQYKLLTLATGCIPDQGTLSVGQWQLARANSGTTPAGTFRGQVKLLKTECGNPSGKRARTQLVRERSSTIVSAR